jgi:hypothetical protein
VCPFVVSVVAQAIVAVLAQAIVFICCFYYVQKSFVPSLVTSLA